MAFAGKLSFSLVQAPDFSKNNLQGVVVKPALAIPFFTGVAAFVGNIVSLTKSIRKWQDTIVNEVLEKLEPVLNRIKPHLIDALTNIIDRIKNTESHPSSEQDQLTAMIPNIEKVRQKLENLKLSIESNSLSGIASNLSDIKESTKGTFRAFQSAGQAITSSSGEMTLEREMTALKDKVGAEALSFQDKAEVTFRKLSETEMVLLLRSLWTSIRWLVLRIACFFLLEPFICREELGLSARNIIIALMTSSLLLGLFLLFIFIGIGIFSDGTDPFAAVVNAGLTLSAGAGDLCKPRLCCPCYSVAAYHNSLHRTPQVSTSAIKTTMQKGAILHSTKLWPNF